MSRRKFDAIAPVAIGSVVLLSVAVDIKKKSVGYSVSEGRPRVGIVGDRSAWQKTIIRRKISRRQMYVGGNGQAKRPRQWS